MACGMNMSLHNVVTTNIVIAAYDLHNDPLGKLYKTSCGINDIGTGLPKPDTEDKHANQHLVVQYKIEFNSGDARIKIKQPIFVWYIY